MRALILSGGVGHDFPTTSGLLAGLLAEEGVAATVTEDIEAGLGEPADLLVVNALRWRMAAERYAHLRDEHAFSLSERGRAALAGHVEAGRPLLAVHTAAICFDDWPQWGRIVGGAWNWERSSHPPPAEARISVRTGAHPVVASVGDFTVEDEVYGFLDLEPDVVPLATAPHGGTDHPLLWARTSGSARVVYDALGHDERSYAQPDHRRLLRQAVRWLRAGGEGVNQAARVRVAPPASETWT